MLTALPDLSKIAIVCANCAAMIVIWRVVLQWSGVREMPLSLVAVEETVGAGWRRAEAVLIWETYGCECLLTKRFTKGVGVAVCVMNGRKSLFDKGRGSVGQRSF